MDWRILMTVAVSAAMVYVWATVLRRKLASFRRHRDNRSRREYLTFAGIFITACAGAVALVAPRVLSGAGLFLATSAAILVWAAAMIAAGVVALAEKSPEEQE